MMVKGSGDDQIRVIVIGAGGRMGKRIIHVISETLGIEIAGGTELQGSSLIGKDIGEVAGIGGNGISISDNLESIINQGDTIIDFTHPETTIANIKLAASYKKGMVIGTTGLSQEQMDQIKEYSKKIGVVQSPNMSVGVNVLFKLIEEAAKALGDKYDIEIIEAHHRHKKDAPSGTALKIAEILARATKRNLNEVAVYGRKGMIGERGDKEIGIHVILGGDIAGDHTVTFCGIGERVQLSHVAHNRDNFARGAVRAALWLSNKSPGLYNMHDVLGLK